MPTSTSAWGAPGRMKRVRDWKVDASLLAGIAWQEEAFLYYRAIGQIRKVENTKANTGAACILKVKRLDENNEPVDLEPNNAQDQAALRVMQAFQGPSGGQRELIRRYMLLADIVGEAFLVGTPTLVPALAAAAEEGGNAPGIVWEFLSRQEIRADRQSLPGRARMVRDRTGALSMQARRVPDDAYVARWHQQDPEFSEQPDAPMRSVIPDAQEYLQLRDVVTGTLKSKMTNGMLIVPKDATFGSYDDSLDDEGESEDDMDPFLEDLLDHMEAAATDRRDPAVYVPIVIMSEQVDALQHIRVEPLTQDNMEWATPLRAEKLLMIAQSLDAPPEEMTGKGDVNHWGMYSMNQEFNGKWVIPRLQDLAGWCTDEYLRPMLQDYEQLTIADSTKYVVVVDDSVITSKADKGVTALRLYDRRLLKAEEVLRSNGFDPDMLPDTEEEVRRFAFDLCLSHPELLTAFTELLGLDEVDVDLDKLEELLKAPAPGSMPLELPAGADTGDGEGISNDNAPGDAPGGDIGPTQGDDPQNNGGETPGTTEPPDMVLSPFDRLVRDLALCADMAADRGVEKAGARVLNLAGKKGGDPTVADRLRNRDKHQVLMLVSRDDLLAMGTSAEGLLEGCWTSFAARATTWVSRWLSDETGMAQSEVGYRTREIVSELVNACQMTLLDTAGDRRFDGMMIPEDALRQVLELELGHVR